MSESNMSLYDISTIPSKSELWESFDLPRYIPQHWVQYSVPSFYYGLLASLVFLIGMVGIPANGIILYLFATEKKLKTSSNLILVSLSLSDLLMLLTNCPLNFASNLFNRWIFGEYGCNFYGFCGCLFGLTSINLIALVSVDRWYQISRSLLMKKMSMATTSVYICAIWIYCTFWATLPLFGLNEYVLEGILTSCTVNYLSQEPVFKFYNLCLFGFCFLLPLAVIVYAYVKIFWMLRKRRTLMSPGKLQNKFHLPNNQSPKDDKDVKMAKIAFYLIIGYLTAWLPYAMVYMMGTLGYSHLITPLVSAFPALMAKTSAIYNPFIYLGAHPLFRQAFVRRFGSIDKEGGSLTFPLTWCVKNGKGGTPVSQVTTTGHNNDVPNFRSSPITAFGPSPPKSLNQVGSTNGIALATTNPDTTGNGVKESEQGTNTTLRPPKMSHMARSSKNEEPSELPRPGKFPPDQSSNGCSRNVRSRHIVINSTTETFV